MSVPQLAHINNEVRVLLNDEEATNWTDVKIRKKVAMAFEELEAELVLAGIPIIQSVSTIMTVPIMNIDDNNLDLSTVSGYPTDMILPIWLKERQVGEMNRDFVDMVECDFIPNVDIQITLSYWCWIDGTILVRGCLNETQVQLRYQRLLTVPELNTDSIIVPLGQLFLAYRVASLCAESINDTARADRWRQTASVNLDKIMRMNIRQLQDLPAKRRPYHRGQGRNRVLRDF